MKPPPLQRHVARFEERNDFASAVLGARRMAQTYKELVEKQTKDAGLGNADPPAESDYLLLGLYAVARTIGEVTDAWTQHALGGQQPAPEPRAPKVGLLR